VDINMGCPVPKIAKHAAGCTLMRTPSHAAEIVSSMAKKVKIPVTVKMRAGWNDSEINAPLLAKMVEDAGASAITVHGRTAAQAYTGFSDWDLIARVAASVNIPVFGSGDCIEPSHVVERMRSGVSGVLVGRGVLRNPWILAQAADLAAGREPRVVTMPDRGQFLLDYIDLLLRERVDEEHGFRHEAPMTAEERARMHSGPAQGRERWVINKLRALNSWYTKGIDDGSHLRIAVNSATSIAELRDLIHTFFMSDPTTRPDLRVRDVVVVP
jgi:tRNA-dihydrouridine synthase B